MELIIVYFLIGLFSAIHLSDVDDVRPTLQYYSQFDDPLREFKERAARVAELVSIFQLLYYLSFNSICYSFSENQFKL